VRKRTRVSGGRGRCERFCAEVVAASRGFGEFAESFAPVRVDAKQMLSEAAQYSVDLRDVHGQQARSGRWKSHAPADTTFCLSDRRGGETMLAKRIPTILRPMSSRKRSRRRGFTVLRGAGGQPRLVGTRPFRSPHHTISDAA